MSKKKTAKARKELDPTLPVFQLKITLQDIEPPIWRRIQTPNCTLKDLHEIIQSTMDWEDDHMHAFEIGDEEYTDLRVGGDTYEFRDSRAVRLRKLVEKGDYSFVYEYDFGDSWRHDIEIESTLPAEENVRYPRCLDGERACPPEDSGGPYGYVVLVDALAEKKEREEGGEEEEYDERLKWLGDAFDPETFAIDAVNDRLLKLRSWIGARPDSHGQDARFSLGDCVRVRQGTVHSQYPDIPLGGWVGIVIQIAWLIPISYKIRWLEETLAAAHPVYLKRCRRDDIPVDAHWLDEGEMKHDSDEPPLEMEQPTNLVVKPLSEDDEDDRARMVFGLTGDDPLPVIDNESEQQYLDHLKTRLTFPFNADDWSGPVQHSVAKPPITVVGFASPSAIDAADGILCEAQLEEKTEQRALVHLVVHKEDPNSRYVDDYKHWRWRALDAACAAEEEDEDDDEEDWDDEEDEEYWDDEDEDDFDEDDEDRDEDAHDDEDSGPRLAGDIDDRFSPPQPIRREQPPVGRNDPCPCGSGKKFKKCCLKKPDGAAE
jgi:hypothetical protein